MSIEQPSDQEFSKEDEKKYKNSGFRLYGKYSAVVFQMLAVIGLGFWGGKKLNEHFGYQNNLITVGVGFLGFGLALYSTIILLNKINKEERV